MIGTVTAGRLNPRQVELWSASGGKVILVDRSFFDLSGWDNDGYAIACNEDVSKFRRAVKITAQVVGVPAEAVGDLEIAASEAASNAVKHGRADEPGRAGRALCEFHCRERRFRLGVLDHGDGIAPEHLLDAVLTPGWSTKDSLGMGWHLMREVATTIWLATDDQGTALVLEYEW